MHRQTLQCNHHLWARRQFVHKYTIFSLDEKEKYIYVLFCVHVRRDKLQKSSRLSPQRVIISPPLKLSLAVRCQEAQCELLLNKYQRFNSKPNVCQRLAKMLKLLTCGAVKPKVTPEKKHVAILFGIYISYLKQFKSLGATKRKEKKKKQNKKKKPKNKQYFSLF